MLKSTIADRAKTINFFIVLDSFSLKTLEDAVSLFDLLLFLQDHDQQDHTTFLLSNKYKSKEWNWLLAEQLKVYPKAKNKVPKFVQYGCWFTSKSYEQSSSEATAHFKANLIHGKRLLDLSGGLGIDDLAFSSVFEKVVSLDPDALLNVLVRRNFQLLNHTNIERLDQTAEAFLQTNTSSFDAVYLDADRRDESGKRQLLLEHHQPNFFEITQAIFAFKAPVLLKLSPLTDIDYCLNRIPNLQSIHIVSINHEVREILCLLNAAQPVHSVEVIANEINDAGLVKNRFSGQEEDRKTLARQQLLDQPSYFYETGSALIKSGLMAAYSQEAKTTCFSPSGIYQVSENPIRQDFFGRSFVIQQAFPFHSKSVQTYLKSNGIMQANVARRDFPETAEALKSKFRLKDGGEVYLFFCTNSVGEKWFFDCRKPTPMRGQQ